MCVISSSLITSGTSWQFHHPFQLPQLPDNHSRYIVHRKRFLFSFCQCVLHGLKHGGCHSFSRRFPLSISFLISSRMARNTLLIFLISASCSTISCAFRNCKSYLACARCSGWSFILSCSQLLRLALKQGSSSYGMRLQSVKQYRQRRNLPIFRKWASSKCHRFPSQHDGSF